MTAPAFLALGGDEIAELRADKNVAMILEWLAWERDRTSDHVLQLVAEGKTHVAAVRSGSVICFEHIIARLNTPASIHEMDDEEFIDPAQRPSRKDRDASTRRDSSSA